MVKSLPAQIWRFGLVGIIGFIVNAGLVEALVKNTGPLWAQTIAFPAAATVTWSLNRRYTFGASRLAPHYEWLRYVLANSVGWAVNNGAYLAIIISSPDVYNHPAIAVAVGSLAGMLFNFTASKNVVFSSDDHIRK